MLSAFKKYPNFIAVIVIALVTFSLYYNSLQNQFLNDWDDGTYVVYNKDIQPAQGGSLIKNAFTKFSNGHYHPLTTISYGVEYKLFGPEAKPFHVFSLVFHILTALLVFAFVKLLVSDVFVAFFTSLLFAVHPTHVESVAWISDRKDLLCTMYYVAALCTYLLYLKKGNNKLYVFTFLFFIAALLSKAMAVTLPLILLLLDYFKDRKISSKVIIEKIPFFVLSLIFGYVSVLAQKSSDALGDITALNIIDRIAFSGYSLTMYIARLFWFQGLSAFYNYPLLENGSYPVIYYVMSLIPLLLFFLLFKLKKHRKLIVFSFGFFVITISLVLQIIPAGNVIMADRYTYLPYIGLFFFLMVLAKQISDRSKKYTNAVYAVLFIYVLSSFYFAFARTKVWKDSMTLWTDTIKNNPDAALPYNNRSVVFMNSGQFSLALADLNKAIEIRPSYVNAHYNRGTVLMRLEKFEEAIQDFTFVSQHECRDIVSVYMNRGDAYMRLKNYLSSIDDFSFAIQNNPNLTQAYYNRGLAFYTINKFEQAIADFGMAVKINSGFTQAYYLRGLSFYKLQDYKQAYTDISYSAKMGYRVNPNLISEISAKLSQ